MQQNNIEEILKTVKEISTEVVTPEAFEVDKHSQWPEKSIRAFQQAGLGGLVASTNIGGKGHGLYGLVRVCETIAEECASTAMCLGMHYVGTAVIAAKATNFKKINFYSLL